MLKKTVASFFILSTMISVLPTTNSTGLNVTVEASSVKKETSQQQFFNSYGEIASKVASESDLYASVMLAQMALESNYGKSGLSKAPTNNLFGIKGSYNGQSVKVATKEDDGAGNLYEIQADFRKYPSAEASMGDYVKLLNNGRYKGVHKSKSSSYKDVTKSLQGVYATDTQYANKLNKIIETYDLTKYDTYKITSPVQFERYVINTGDTLESIAKKYGKTKYFLKYVNNLTSEELVAGQTLLVNEVESKVGEYIIELNDTLDKIAEKHNTTKDILKALNNSESELLFAGDPIKVPLKVEFQEYTIVSGDTLYEISKTYGIEIDQIKKDNDLNSNLIRVGEVLKIRVK